MTGGASEIHVCSAGPGPKLCILVEKRSEPLQPLESLQFCLNVSGNKDLFLDQIFILAGKKSVHYVLTFLVWFQTQRGRQKKRRQKVESKLVNK